MSRNPNISYCKTKYVRQFTKLNAQFQRVLLCHIEQNPNDNLAALSISSKSGYKLFQATIRSYLKVTNYLWFKAQRKPFLIQKYKDARLYWAHKYIN